MKLGDRGAKRSALWRWFVVALIVAASAGTESAIGAPSSGDGGIVEIPLTFGVENTNTSAFQCLAVPGHYQLKGWLVAPKSALTRQLRAVTLYLHGLNGNLWRIKEPSGYDYAAEMARLGHMSVVVDRLGYAGTLPQPNGFATCLGAQADMAHQIVTHLRYGTYFAEGIAPIRFDRLALAAHSAGGGIAEIEAYSYRDVDALITIAHADTEFSARAKDQELPKTAQVCAQGGQQKYDPQAGGGYGFFPTTDTVYRELFFFNVARDVINKATALRERDPCGDLDSFVPMTLTNQQHLRDVQVPVLLVFGENDAVFTSRAPDAQRRLYANEAEVDVVALPRTGHVPMLEKTAPELRANVHDWLARHGF